MSVQCAMQYWWSCLIGVPLQAAARGVQLLLPTDVVVAKRFAKDAPARTVAADAIPDGWMVRSLLPASLLTF